MNNVLIKDNQRKIDRFDLEFYIKHKEFSKASAVAALHVANKITEAYYDNYPNNHGEKVMRLYALLQGLFVSIDAMYALSYTITGSNDAININNNPYMRTLRYIRNDVVGHPANRTLSTKNEAYCILDESSISMESFKYNIYSNDITVEKTINIDELLTQYFIEANSFLDAAYHRLSKYNDTQSLKPLISKAIDNYYRTSRFLPAFNDFMYKYKHLYPESKKEQHRILWRYELVLRLNDISNENKDIIDVAHYAIGLELNKIYASLYGTDYKHKKDFELPTMVLSVYRFLNRNPEYIPYVKHLKDPDHALFYESLRVLYEAVSMKKMEAAADYFGFMITLYKGSQKDLVYAIALPVREYRKKE